MILVDRLLAGGIGFVLDKIAAAVDAEMNDADRLREELLAAEMQKELGELSDEEFAGLEAALLGRLREIRAAERGEREGALSGVAGVEVSFDVGAGEEEESARGG
jgi:hypothetical protein